MYEKLERGIAASSNLECVYKTGRIVPGDFQGSSHGQCQSGGRRPDRTFLPVGRGGWVLADANGSAPTKRDAPTVAAGVEKGVTSRAKGSFDDQ
jgi:hypothetical protein